MAGVGDLSRGGWALRPDRHYTETMRSLDGTAFLGHARANLFLQFGTRDAFVTRATAQRMIDATASARVAWYDADHSLSAAALRDRSRTLGARSR